MSGDTHVRREPPLELGDVTDNWFIGPLRLYDVLVILLVAVFTVALFVVGPPLFLDDFYHMGVAQEIYLLGYVPTWDFWEFAPLGRPHLYPPLLNVLMALCMKFSGGDVFFAARIFKVISNPFIVFCFWYSAKEFAGSKSAFYSTMALASIYPLLFHSYMIMPASLILGLTCLLFVTFTRKKLLTSIALMALMLWLHIAMPLLTIIALFALGLIRRKEGYLEFFLKVMVVSALLYSPWLIHVVSHIEWLSSGGTISYIFIPFIVWALGLPGFVLSFKYYKADYFVYTLYAFSLIPIFFGYSDRFWIYLIIPLSFFVGVTLSRHIGSRGGKWKAVKIILVLLIAVTALTVTPAIGGTMSTSMDRIPELNLPSLIAPTPLLHLLLLPPPYRSMITPDILPLYLACGWIRANTQPFQPICFLGYLTIDASVITAFTGRPTIGGSWLEVMDPITQVLSQLYTLYYGTVYVVAPPFSSPPASIPSTLVADFGPIKIFVRS